MMLHWDSVHRPKEDETRSTSGGKNADMQINNNYDDIYFCYYYYYYYHFY